MPQVTVKKMVEGASSVVIKVDLVNDDGSGELSDVVIFSPSDCTPSKSNSQPAFRIMQVWYGMVWFDVTLKYGTLQPERACVLARDAQNHIDFRSFGGIVDTRMLPPSDENGKLTISTNDFGNLGAQGFLIIELRKL